MDNMLYFCGVFVKYVEQNMPTSYVCLDAKTPLMKKNNERRKHFT